MPDPSRTLLNTFQPLIDAARNVELEDSNRAERELASRFDPEGPAAELLRAQLVELLDAGEIAHRGEPPVRFGRVSKAAPETANCSIDVVDMTGVGPRHAHPAGEIDYCIALEGTPTFDGRPPGWVVCEPGSVHAPTVAGGRMLIVYLLPGGAIDFDPPAGD